MTWEGTGPATGTGPHHYTTSTATSPATERATGIKITGTRPRLTGSAWLSHDPSGAWAVMVGGTVLTMYGDRRNAAEHVSLWNRRRRWSA